MLKKIPTTDVSLGMFLQSLEGAWLSHPFWKTKFVLTDPADLASLQASGVPAVWIDISKGNDSPVAEPLEPGATVAAPAPSPEQARVAAPPRPPAQQQQPRASMEAELDR